MGSSGLMKFQSELVATKGRLLGLSQDRFPNVL